MCVAGVDGALAAGVDRHRRASDDVLEGRRATAARASLAVRGTRTRAVGMLSPGRRIAVTLSPGATKVGAAAGSTIVATSTTTVAIAAGTAVGTSVGAVATGAHGAIVGPTTTSTTAVIVVVAVAAATTSCAHDYTCRVTRRAYEAGATTTAATSVATTTITITSTPTSPVVRCGQGVHGGRHRAVPLDGG
eukprot:COSAG02_NODE_10548_length_1916_cov_3.674188_2_plen_191_part_00